MFKDAIYQKAMEEQGFNLFPFLSANEVNALQKLFDENVENGQIAGMYANHNRNEVAKSKKISKEIIQILNEKLSLFFEDFSPFVAHFVVKNPRTTQEFSLHQDWNIVDEKKYKSYHIWMPLSLTHQGNGGMFVVPKSHQFFNNHRSGSLGTPVLQTSETLQNLKTDLIIPAGNALCWHDATFHGSYPNLSGEARISVVLVVHEKKAPNFYYHYNNETEKIDLYPLSADSLLENLPTLEKGNLPETWEKTDSIPMQTINNRNIEINQIKEAYRKVNEKNIDILPILNSESLSKKLREDGFIIFKDFLDYENIQEALKILNTKSNFQNYMDQPRYTSMEKESVGNKNTISSKIECFLSPLFNVILNNYKCPVFQFFIKMPHSDGEVGMHTDTTLLLNPAIEPHYGIWIPLQDVDENSGTLMLAKGSHQWYNGVLTSSVNWPFFPYLSKIEAKAIKLNLKAGDLVVFDNRLIHGSTFNASEKPRLCIAGRVTHQYSQYYSFFKENPNEEMISVYEEADDFYLNEQFNGDKDISPTGKFIGKIAQPIFDPDKMKMNE